MSAIISDCGRYRYRLDREIGMLGSIIIAFLLHNPSTADADKDDPTSRRGIGFARSWGASRMVFINPWAGRATKPADLWKMDDPVGPENDRHIREVALEVVASGGFMVAAWGAVSPPRALHHAVANRLSAVRSIITDAGCELRALGVTQDGAPRHPLYLPATAVPLPWPAHS